MLLFLLSLFAATRLTEAADAPLIPRGKPIRSAPVLTNTVSTQNVIRLPGGAFVRGMKAKPASLAAAVTKLPSFGMGQAGLLAEVRRPQTA